MLGRGERQGIEFTGVHCRNGKNTQTERCYYYSGSRSSDVCPYFFVSCLMVFLLLLFPFTRSSDNLSLMYFLWMSVGRTDTQTNEHMISVCSFFVCVTHARTHTHTHTHTVRHNSTSLFWTNSLSGGAKFFFYLSIISYKMGWDVIQT